MPKTRSKHKRSQQSNRKVSARAASAVLSDESDVLSSSESDSDFSPAPKVVSKRKTPKRRKKTRAQPARRAVHNADSFSTPEPQQKAQGEPVDEEYRSDGEDALHGPCGEPMFGQDVPPKRFRKLIDEQVALEFDVDGEEDLILFTGVVEGYKQANDKFLVCIFVVCFDLPTVVVS